ncbi:MAG: malonyl-ACP O-methyltransferase BioC [Hahellaceae bacterium]|nr:malonyl-ACP O-methyltransferase BioC [Hahellaceae bacterium]
MSQTVLKAQIAEAFSRAAETYDALACVQKTAGLTLLERVADRIPQRILDIGCGSGWLTQKFARRFPGASVWALDLAPGMIRHLRQCCPEISGSILADMEALPFKEASFDLVYSNFAMQWLDNPELFFRESYRLLTPGGRLLCSTLLPGTLSELSAAWMQADNQPHINHFLPVGDVRDAAERAGWSWSADIRKEVVYYPDAFAVLRALKGIGANTLTAEHAPGLGLSGRQRLLKMQAAYENAREPQGVPASYEILYCTLCKS